MGALWMEGAAREVQTAPAGSQTAVELVEAVELTAGFGVDRRLVHLDVQPDEPWMGELLGTRAGGGFRSRIDEVAPEGDMALARQLLDDLPAGALIASYSLIRLAQRLGHEPATTPPPERIDRLLNTCSGWREGGLAMRSVRACKGVPVQDCPPATDLAGDDPSGWHPMKPLAPDVMRRRRLVDVVESPGGPVGGGPVTKVWSMFRDTIGEPGGMEAVLHEYVVRMEARAGLVESIVAEPRVLPFPECPAAAGAVGALVGVRLEDLPTSAVERLSGVDCCTHLNDLLRSLGVVTVMCRR
jgi:hypothetical protein